VNAKTTIKKILFITVWLCIGGGMFILLMAAITKKNKGLCKNYSITIKGAEENLFIDENDVAQLLMKATGSAIKGEPVASFNLHDLEHVLENNTWISHAELYFDNQDELHVTITERDPVARIITSSGSSYYIDKTGNTMPLSEKLSARVPVFTGFPSKKKLNSSDSLLLNQIRLIGNYIMKEPFWLSQVAQVEVTPEKTFEMIPLVGNHIVRLGNGENIAAKFNRLMVFYRQVLSKTGFDKYKLIDVQYKGQVVASRYAGDAKVDSIQLRKNVEKLLRKSADAEKDTVERVLLPIVKLEKDSADTPEPSLQDKGVMQGKENARPVDKDAGKKRIPVQPGIKKGPKAVMPKNEPASDANNGYN
jgi:cell division protein FtsQ